MHTLSSRGGGFRPRPLTHIFIKHVRLLSVLIVCIIICGLSVLIMCMRYVRIRHIQLSLCIDACIRSHSHNVIHTHPHTRLMPYSFTGAAIAGFALGYSPDLAIKAGLRAAYLSVQSSCCIAHNVSPELFSEESIANWAPWTPSRFFGTL